MPSLPGPETVAYDATAAPPLAGLLALGMLVGTINGLSRVALPLYAATLGAQAWQIGVVGGLGYSGILLLALPMGAWIDRHGSRLLLTRGVVAAALVYLLLPQARTPGGVVLGAALLGLLLPLRTIPVNTEFLALLPRMSASRAGWNRAANTLGMFFVGPAVAGAVVAAFGFAPVFVLAAAALLLAGLLGRRVLALDARGAQQAGDATLADRIRAQVALLAEHADLRRTMAIDLLAQMAVAYFVVFALVLAVRRFGMPAQAAAALVTVQGALYVLTLFAGGGILRRWHEETRYLVAFVLLLAQSLLYAWGSAAAALWLGAALLGVGTGLQGLTSSVRYGELMWHYGRGRIGGLTSLAAPAGGAVGAMLGGLVSQRFGIEAGFGVLAAAFAFAALAQFRRLRRRPGPRAADAKGTSPRSPAGTDR